MANYQFNVSESTIKKYVNIKIDVFNDRDKLFYKYIYILIKEDFLKNHKFFLRPPKFV
jgi:hypothetical protein